MLSQRFSEEVLQTKTEMLNHLKSLISVRDTLEIDLGVLGKLFMF